MEFPELTVLAGVEARSLEVGPQRGSETLGAERR